MKGTHPSPPIQGIRDTHNVIFCIFCIDMTLVIEPLISSLDQRSPLTAMTDSSPECLWLDHIREAVAANALTTMPRAYPAVLQLSGMDSAIRPLNKEQMARTFLYEL